LLLAITIILTGKAVVSYEIFTGKTLPRRGFLRQWRGVVSISAVASALIAWCIGVELRPIYALLIVVVLATATFALLSWRFFREREEMLQQLRPFAASRHLVEQVLSLNSESSSPNADALRVFHVLCEELLETTGARLTPLGALAPLVPATLAFPDEQSAPTMPADLATMDFASHRGAFAYSSASENFWLVPLWSARGLSGVLLLGEKQRGALFAEEEIALAQAAGEQLLDALAGATLATRLMELQRHRLSEVQLADTQSTLRLRRALHDDVLPRLHATLLHLSGDEEMRREAQTQLTAAHQEISNLLRSMPSALPTRLAQHGLLGALRQSVQDEWNGSFDSVEWVIDEDAERYATTLAPVVAETLFHAAREAIRNAARHARGDGTQSLSLHVAATVGDEFRLTIEDDGVGHDQAGQTASTSFNDSAIQDHSQRDGVGGHGLALHSTMMAVAGGSLSVETRTPRGTRVVLSLPRNAASTIPTETEVKN
jgi:signal transduction histidine kinase